MKIIYMFCLFVLVSLAGNAQNNIIIQQNNTAKQKQEPKVVYKDKVVYVEKQRQGPILVAGYLYVYPEKLGCFKKCPNAIINSINKKRAYGRNTWRLPTLEEVTLIEASKEINLHDYGVWSKSQNWGITTVLWALEIKYMVFSDDDKVTGCLVLVCDN